MKHCLVVDDSRVVRKVACQILETFSFETEEAPDGATALHACRTRMPDVILLDAQMPDMTGAEFLRSLRRDKKGKDPVVVFCTIENDPTQIGEALSAGANEYVMKPFDRDSLAAALAEAGLLGERQ
ncbi:MAG TPA: response regulator [Rhizomicrobium sp.]|jgi:two-component system chemotaxis response regulator CheY